METILVTEFLRPDNDKIKQAYFVPPDVVVRAQRLEQAGYELCCDIYPSDAARVYLYRSIDDSIMSSKRIPHSVIADVAMVEIVREFDLDKYL